MSLMFDNIRIENFGSIGEIELCLNEPGVHVIIGINKDSGGSNGSGKSTIWEALFWTLYGKTTKLSGRSLDSLVNNKTSGDLKVTINLTKKNVKYRIVRKIESKKHSVEIFRNDQDATLKDIIDNNELIRNIIGVDDVTFRRGYYLSQKALPSFAEMTDKELKKYFIHDFLDIEWIDKAFNNVKESKKRNESQIEKIEYNKKLIEHQKEQLSDRSFIIKEDMDRWEEKTDVEIKELKNKILGYKQKQKDLMSDWNERKIEIEDIELELTNNANAIEIDQKHNKLQDMFMSTSLDMGSLQTILSESDIVKKEYELKIDNINSKEKCEVCDGDLTDHNKKYMCRTYIYNVEEINKKYSQVKIKYNKLKDIQIKIQEKLETIDKDCINIKQLEKKRDRIKTQLQDIQNRIEYLDNNIKLCSDQIIKKEEESNPYISILEDNRKQLSDCNIKIENFLEELNVCYNEREFIDFWMEGFSVSGIQSMMLENVTPILNNEINCILSELTRNTISVTFNTIERLKSGKIKEKYNLEVINNVGGSTYNSLSGGEARRVDFSISLAMANIIRTNINTINILILDEPFVSLDSEGISDIMDFIQGYYENIPVFIISHSDVGLDGNITIQKINGISELV